MALKPLRDGLIEQSVDHFINEVAFAGQFVVSNTGVIGSGQAMDSFNQLVTVAATPSGRTCFGVLLQNSVNKDLTQTALNPYNEEVQVGNKIAVARQGIFVSNYISGATNSVPQTSLFLSHSGWLSTTQTGGLAKVAEVESKTDEAGYTKFRFVR